MNYEFASPGPINTDIRIAGGMVNVDAGDHDVITVSVEPADSGSASREAAEQTRVSLDGGQLIVHAPRSSGWTVFRWPKLNITVRIPTGSSLTVKSASADVTCTGAYAEAMVHTASGDVNADRILKDASLRSASGDIRAASIGGNLSATTASGDVRVQHVGGEADLHSASGDLEVGRADGSVRAKSASGDVAVGAARQGEVRVNTASGDVTIGVVAGTGVWLEISTASGRTISDLNMHANVEAPPTGAALRIKARTASGDVNLRRVTAAA